MNVRTTDVLVVEPTQLERPASPTPAKKNGSLRSLLGFSALAVAVPSVISLFIGLFLSTNSIAEHRNAERLQMLSALTEQASLSIEPLLSAGQITAARRVVSALGEAPGVTQCSLSLPDGRILASSDVKAIDAATLPDSWQGPIENEPKAGESLDPYVLRTIVVAGRGSLLLRVNFDPVRSGLTLSDATAYSLLSVVVLLLILFSLRKFRQRFITVSKLAEAVSALSLKSGAPLDQFKLSEAEFSGAEAWNALIGRFAELENTSRELQMRDLLGQRDAGASETRSDPDRAGLESVVDLLPTGVVVLDAKGIVRACNGAGASLIGLDVAAIIGTDVRTVLDDETFRQVLGTTLNRTFGGERRSVEIDRREHHGGVIRLNIRPLRREDHGGCLVTMEDVTQQRIADSARNQFVAQATHELRAPLTNMRLCLEAALEDDASNVEALTQHLNVINDETRRLERLVSEMLSVAEIEAGSLSLKEDDVRLDRLFEDLKSNNIGACKEKELQLVFELPPKLPLLRGDRDKIAAALQNLLNNAVKYTPAGGKVSVIARQDGDRFLIDIADTGFGIAAEEQPKIFGRFFRAKDPRVAKVTGTGLGLALSREIARLHGGDLSFKSELNQGTTFTFQLPVALQPA